MTIIEEEGEALLLAPEIHEILHSITQTHAANQTKNRRQIKSKATTR